MENLFLTAKKPLLTVMLLCETADEAIGKIKGAICQGAEAFCMQVELLRPEFHNRETYERLFRAMRGRPCYVTYYRGHNNKGKTDEEIADGLLLLAESGAALCDVQGDLFCKDPEQLTMDAEAAEKQKALIRALHEKGAGVLMSAHVLKFKTPERVLEMARVQESRGADVCKLVTDARTMEEQLENLRATLLLSRELKARSLFLSGGMCSLHRRLGMHLGTCMVLCTYVHDARSSFDQPLLSAAKQIRDELGFQNDTVK